MQFLRRSLIGLFLFGTTLGLLALAGQTVMSTLREKWAAETPDTPIRERVFAVNMLMVESGDIRPVMAAFGEIRSRRTLDLRASASGTVIELSEGMVEGGTVEAGALLLRIDPADMQSARDVARTELAEAEDELRDATRALALAGDELRAAEDQAELRERALTRQRGLRDRGVGTEAAVETAELAASSAEQAALAKRQALAQAEAREAQAGNALERRRLGLADAERRLADTELYAEFTGALSDVTVVKGGLLSNGERVARLIDPLALEVSFRVSTSQYARLLDEDGRLMQVPIRAKLDLYGVDLTAEGRISRESAAVGAGQTGRQLYAVLTRSTARGLRPGDFVTVEIDEPLLRDVVQLPATAVDAAGRLLVLGEDDRLEEHAVEVLRKQKNDVILRAPGLDGAEVVAERTPLIGEGIRVRPVRRDQLTTSDAPVLVELTPERRARLIAFVEGNGRMPEEVKARILSKLNAPMVPQSMIDRLEARMGG